MKLMKQSMYREKGISVLSLLYSGQKAADDAQKKFIRKLLFLLLSASNRYASQCWKTTG